MQEDNIAALLRCGPAMTSLKNVPDELLREALSDTPDEPTQFYTPLENNKIMVATDGSAPRNHKPWITIDLGALIGNRHTDRSLLESLLLMFRWRNEFKDPSDFKAWSKELKANPVYVKMLRDSLYPCSVLGQRTETDPRHPEGSLRVRTPFLLTPHTNTSISGTPVYEQATGNFFRPNIRIGISKYSQLFAEVQREEAA